MKTEKRIPVQKMHADHLQWLTDLAFYKDVLVVAENRLADINKKNNQHAITAWTEHFQNQFLLQNRELIILEKGIRKSEKIMEKAVAKFPAAFNEALVNEHAYLKERVIIYEKLFKAMRTEFNKFSSKVM
jgi:hypothetical protein